MLEEGARVWVHVPQHGYVGVGVVKGPAAALKDFKVDDDGVEKPLAEVLGISLPEDEPAETMEYCAPVKWLHTEPLEGAVWHRGFFANQNSAARPTSRRWEFTIQQLKARFGVKD